jgi:hypothetical protein
MEPVGDKGPPMELLTLTAAVRGGVNVMLIPEQTESV